MPQYPSTFEDFLELAHLLENAGITAKYKYAENAVSLFHRTRDFRYIKALLERLPHLIQEALQTLAEFPYAPEPRGKELVKIKGRYNIGYVNKGGDEVSLDSPDFLLGLLGLGELGIGKTYPILRLERQMLSIPIDERGFNLLIVQTLKKDADFHIREFPNLRIIDWKNFRRAPLEVEEWDTPQKKSNSFCAVFSSINWLMSHGQPIFGKVLEKCYRQNGVFDGPSRNFPNFTEIYNEIDRVAKEMKLDGYEHRNVRDHLKFVTYALKDTKEILDCKHGFAVQDFFSKEDIVINVLPEDESNNYVVGTIMVDIFKDLQRYYEKHPIYPPRLRTLIVIDECRRLFPSSDQLNDHHHNPDAALESFVATRRSSGIGIIAVTQEPRSVPHWLLSNSAYILAFPIGGQARKDIQQLINLTDEQSSFIDELPKYTAIFRDRRFNRRYLVRIPGDLEIKQINDEEVAKLMAPFIQQLHAQLETEIPVGSDSIDLNQIEKTANVQKIGIQILRRLKEDQFLHHTQLHKLLKNEEGFSRSDIDLALDWLQKQQLIFPKKCRATKKRDATYYALTPISQESLGIPESERIADSRYKHYLYSSRVRSSLASEGYEAILEYSEGDPQISIRTKSGDELKIPKRIDVVTIKNGEKNGYEITLSFSNLLSNLYKCLEVFKVDQVYIVCERKKPDLEKARKIVEQNVPENLHQKIGYLSMSHFL